jgi:hypothetical protein
MRRSPLRWILASDWYSGQPAPLADFHGTLQQRDLVAHMESRVNDTPGGNEETGDEQIEDGKMIASITFLNWSIASLRDIERIMKNDVRLT